MAPFSGGLDMKTQTSPGDTWAIQTKTNVNVFHIGFVSEVEHSALSMSARCFSQPLTRRLSRPDCAGSCKDARVCAACQDTGESTSVTQKPETVARRTYLEVDLLTTTTRMDRWILTSRCLHGPKQTVVTQLSTGVS